MYTRLTPLPAVVLAGSLLLVTTGISGCPDEDLDGDGYSTSQGDCDDANPQVHPGAPEVCGDGIDNDCDATIDEDLDQDADGVTTCQGDCNDTDGAIYPGAAEVCDGADTDCDGVLPSEESDADDDGSLTCASDTVPADCDDTDPSAYPGALETCDGADNDCDGAADEDLAGCSCRVGPSDSGAEYADIQDALDAVLYDHAPCAIIRVAPGTYGPLNFGELDRPLVVTSDDGPEVTTIDGGGQAPGALFASSTISQDVVLRGFTIRAGRGYRSQECAQLTYGCGGGAAILNGATPTLEENVFLLNTATSGGAIYISAAAGCDDCGTVLLRGNIIGRSGAGNSADYGAGIYVSGIGLTLEGHHQIAGNVAGRYGGAIYAASSQVTISSADITANSVPYQGYYIDVGGGALYLSNCNTSIRDAAFLDNSSGNTGGAIAARGGTLVVDESVFEGNSAFSGGAISCDSAEISQSRFEGNGAEIGGALSVDILTLQDSQLVANRAEDGAAIHAYQSITLTDVELTGNVSTASASAIYGWPDATLERVVFARNEGPCSVARLGSANLEEVLFYDNTVSRDCALIEIGGSSSSLVTHTIVADNHLTYADNPYGALLLTGTGMKTVHYNTIVRSDLAVNGTEVYNRDGQLSLSGNILVGQGTGIGVYSNTSVQDCAENDAWRYPTTFAPSACSGILKVDPSFLASSDDEQFCNEDYHLRPGSPVIGMGAYGDGEWALAPEECE